jgi:oligoribonuclease NrnB/cAMP/cGMP phosphodiesterase (DHH superfamily)
MLVGIIKEFRDVKFVFIDHHPVTFQLVDLPNLTLVLDTSKSASKLTSDFFGFNDTFVEAVNAFDIWDINSKYFKYGFMLNSLFWDYRPNSFIAQFKSMNKPNQKQLEDYQRIKDKKDKHFETLKKKGLLLSSNGTLVSFTDKHLNWIQIDYPNEEFYINATSYGTINVRIGDVVSQDRAGELKDVLTESLQTEEWFVDIGGHPRAFGISHKGSNDHIIIVQCVKHIVDEIAKMKG